MREKANLGAELYQHYRDNVDPTGIGDKTRLKMLMLRVSNLLAEHGDVIPTEVHFGIMMLFEELLNTYLFENEATNGTTD